MKLTLAALGGGVALLFASLAWAFSSPAHAQQIAEQIPPAHPQFLLVGRDTNGRDIFIEATTMGRVGNNGFVWQLEAGPGADPLWTRFVINCTTRGMLHDWEVQLNNDFSMREQGPGGFSRSSLSVIDDTIIGYACAGEALPQGRLYHGLQSAVSASLSGR